MCLTSFCTRPFALYSDQNNELIFASQNYRRLKTVSIISSKLLEAEQQLLSTTINNDIINNDCRRYFINCATERENVSPYHNIVDKPNALQIENHGIHVSTTKLDNFLYESDMNQSLNFLLVSDPSYDGLITASEFTWRRFQLLKIIIFAIEAISFGIWPIEIHQAKEEKKLASGANFDDHEACQNKKHRSFPKTSS